VVVAVAVVRPVQPSSDEVIDVIAVRNRLVTAAVAMAVRRVAVDRVGMTGRMRLIDANGMLVDVVAMRVVHMSVVQVVDVIVVLDRGVPAIGAVLVRM
jgi:hypothetical protein